MNLKQQYESYLEEERDFEKSLAVFQSKKKDLENVIARGTKNLDNDLLDELDVNVNIDFDRLSDMEYISSVQKTIHQGILKLETRGKELLEGTGYVENTTD